MPHVFKRGSIYHGWFYEDGARVQRSTHCTDKRAAEAVVARWERVAADPDSGASDEATMRDAIAQLITDRSTRAGNGERSEQTVEFYRRKSGYLVRHFGAEFRIARLSAPEVDAYVASRRTEGAAEHTIAKELTTLRAALKLCLRAQLWRGSLDAIMPVRFSPAYRPRERKLTEAEVDDLLRELEPDRAARVAYIVGTGARLGESDRAQRGDVVEARDGTWFAYLRGTKTAASRRTVPIMLAACRRFLEFSIAAGEGKDGALFTGWANPVRDLHTACVRAEIDPCSPNDLRRTFGTWHREAGIAPHDVGAILGHTSGAMVEKVYGRLGPEALALRVATQLAVAPVQQTPRHSVDSVDGVDSTERDLPGDSCRRSESNRRPWDYDSRARRPVTCHAHRRKRDGTAETVAPVQQRARRGGR